MCEQGFSGYYPHLGLSFPENARHSIDHEKFQAWNYGTIAPSKKMNNLTKKVPRFVYEKFKFTQYLKAPPIK